jgi:hypothetical protein
MNITGKVMGVRIYQSGKRYVTLDWEDPDIRQFPMHHTIEVLDDDKIFELGDVVEISFRITSMGSTASRFSRVS